MNITPQFILFLFLLIATNKCYSQTIYVDDFEGDAILEFPERWNVRGDQALSEYLVQQDSMGNNYLAAKTLDSDMFILKKNQSGSCGISLFELEMEG